MADFEADPHPCKVSLIAGAYREENGKPWVLPTVEKAKEHLREATHEYLGIAGSPSFINLAKDLLFGPVASRLEDNCASIQTVSGTGANHLAATFLARRLRPNRVLIPAPTWINHKTIWETAGVKVAEYPYYCSATKKIDIVGMLNALDHAEPNEVVILQACARNPTGVDLSKSQWVQVADLVRRKKLFVVFDSAYQGFATGDLEGDAWAIRLFTENVLAFDTHPGLCVTVILEEFWAVRELVAIARAEYSNPPRFGASIVETILLDQDLRAQWISDLETMSSRIRSMRRELRQRLEKETQHDWAHVETQIGMFSYAGLTKEQVSRLRSDFHVYLLPSGRLSLCGLNEGNVQYVAHAIGEVTKS
ncbi:uncharacterized protein N7477_005879 [Penicillium maclennaniae]|uniref:uncharacterized protein n=1 Tax=Penicillium maclennaniae TaxID=1343394 RepID=UPI002541F044|nr:uncharacterized protein N7477_005879 [Penicillium maclennaniae]KAJ5670516.1 hypothetical protein N7477_005879 [Penicillium maclennaniae]